MPIQARKRFGQHFLEPAWVVKVLRAIDPAPADTFIEIGPGRGALTGPLLAGAGRVVAYEIDRDLAADLAAREAQPGEAPLSVVTGDFLDVSPEQVRAALAAALDGMNGVDGVAGAAIAPGAAVAGRLRVAGNLPYNVASPILFRLLDLYAAGLPIVDACVMLQREVADRLLAHPGTKEYGVLSVLIGHRARVDKLLALPPGAFRPSPQVHSTVVRLRFHPPEPPAADLRAFTALTQAIFTRRRKTLANALLAYPPSATHPPKLMLERAGIDGGRRPETLEVAELVRLADTFAEAVV